MTSARLRRHLERELVRLHAAGRGQLVQSFLQVEDEGHGGDLSRLDRYVERCRELVRGAREAGADELALVLRYFAARTLAYPLDRPKEAIPELVDLNAELATRSRRQGGRGIVHALAELELLRAFHKVDAPGWRDTIVAGLRDLWPHLRDDLGPQTELLDVYWRTGFWCRDVALMRAANRLAQEVTRSLQFSASYWHARELALEGRHAEAASLLAELLEKPEELDGSGDLWRHYLAVELAANEAESGRANAAQRRLDGVVAELGELRDPMLLWDVARARAACARASGDVALEVAAWGQALAVVDGLGTDRLTAEFAVSLATAAARNGDRAAVERARGVLDATLPALRSAADLRAAAGRIPGLYS